jgi:hypothetical protein
MTALTALIYGAFGAFVARLARLTFQLSLNWVSKKIIGALTSNALTRQYFYIN